MDALLIVEPFGFFTLDALRAGWHLVWRQVVRVVPVAVVGGIVGGLLTGFRMPVLGAVIIGLGVIVAVIWGAVLIPQLTSRWAEARYGHSLSGPVSVWWGVTWRVVVASLVAGVILTPPNLVTLSLSAAFKNSALGMLGQVLTGLLGVVNVIVTVMATGWAMSRVTDAQLSGLPVASASFPPAPIVGHPLPVVPTRIPAAAPVAPPVAAALPPSPPAPSVPAGRAGGKRQCPKCGLYETERGAVIGWYCTVCGWREGRR
jgi:hypothetical protein